MGEAEPEPLICTRDMQVAAAFCRRALAEVEAPLHAIRLEATRLIKLVSLLHKKVNKQESLLTKRVESMEKKMTSLNRQVSLLDKKWDKQESLFPKTVESMETKMTRLIKQVSVEVAKQESLLTETVKSLENKIGFNTSWLKAMDENGLSYHHDDIRDAMRKRIALGKRITALEDWRKEIPPWELGRFRLANGVPVLCVELRSPIRHLLHSAVACCRVADTT